MAFSVKQNQKQGPPEIRGVSASLTAQRRDKLLNMKKREDMKDVLVKKFTDRYSGKDAAKDKELISSEVEEFMENAAITDANLKRLERRIEKKTSKDDIDAVSVSNYSVTSSVRAARDADATAEIARAPADWKILDEYAVYLHELDAVQQKQRKKESAAQLHKELDEQVAASKYKNVSAMQENNQFFKNQMQELEQWRQAEQQKIVDKRAKNLNERKIQDEQLAENKRIKKEELARKRAEEELQVKRIERELKEEQERIEAKKIAQKASMAKVFQENVENRAKKEAEKAAQVQKDIATIKEYNRIMDEQEKSRAAELEARQARQKMLMDRMKDTVVAQAESKGAEDEERARKQAQERDMRAMEMELNKQEKLKQMRNDNRDYLLKQMADKNEKKIQGLELKNLQAGILDADTKAFAVQEKEKKEKMKKRNLAFRVSLQEQIADRERAAKEVDMSEAEARMNGDLLDMVYKTLQERDANSPTH